MLWNNCQSFFGQLNEAKAALFTYIKFDFQVVEFTLYTWLAIKTAIAGHMNTTIVFLFYTVDTFYAVFNFDCPSKMHSVTQLTHWQEIITSLKLKKQHRTVNFGLNRDN